MDLKEANEVKAKAAQEVLQFLDKLLQGYRTYKEDHNIVKQFENSLLNGMQRYNKEQKCDLTLSLRPFELHCCGQSVYRNTNQAENFTFRLFQDGIRSLIFNKAITLQELHDFVQILRLDYQSENNLDENSSTLMWKHSFKGIQYIAVETFVEEEDQRGHVADEIAAMINSLKEKELQKGGKPEVAPDQVRIGVPIPRRLKKEDALITQAGSTVPPSGDFAEATRLELLAELDRDDTSVARKTLIIMLRSLANENDDDFFHHTARSVLDLFVTLLQQRELPYATKVAMLINGLAYSGKNPSAKNTALMQELATQLFREEAMTPLRAMLRDYKLTDEAADPLMKLLAAVPRDKAQALLTVLPEVTDRKLRQAMLQWGGDAATPILCEMAQHADTLVRREALTALKGKNSRPVLQVALKALRDQELSIRMQALSTLSASEVEAESKNLLRLMSEEAFANKSFDERKAFVLTLVKLGGSAVVKPLLALKWMDDKLKDVVRQHFKVQ